MTQRIERSLRGTVRVCRAADDATTQERRLEGYAVVYDTPSAVLYTEDDGTPVRERIARGAMPLSLLDASDICMTVEHDINRLLARSRYGEGTLSYGEDDHGVRFEFSVPNSTEGTNVWESVSRGDICGCSFIAYVDPDDISVERSADGTMVTLHRFTDVRDFTLTAMPAYPATETAIVRSLVAAQPPEPTSDTSITSETPETPETSETLTPNTPSDMTIEPENVRPAQPTLTEVVRTALATGQREIRISRAEDGASIPTTSAPTASAVQTAAAATTTGGANATTAGQVPTTFAGLLDDVAANLVYGRVGIPITHNNVGEFVWTAWGAGSCQEVGEAEALTVKTLDLSKIKCSPVTYGAMYELSREVIENTNGIVESIVMRAMQLEMQRALDAVLMSTVKPAGSSVSGPLVGAAAKAVAIGTAPTYKSINGLKAKLLATGIANNPVWVVSPKNYCDLEATPRDAGSGIMCIENGHMCGYPVFVSNNVGDTYICLGDFSQQAAGFFGNVRLLIDPYTDGAKNMVRFILHFQFGTATLRPEAFVAGKLAAS